MMLSLFFLLFNGYSQISFFGDLVIGANTEFHIAFPKTYFKGGILFTDRNSSKSVVSFGSKSQWEAVSDDSYVDGSVRIYHSGDFRFPTGNQGIFSPLRVTSLNNPIALQISYQWLPLFFYPSDNSLASPPKHHFWSWQTTAGSAYINLSWNPKHQLARNFEQDPTKNELLTELKIAGLNFNQWEAIPSLLEANTDSQQSLISWESGGLSSKIPIDFISFNTLSFGIQSKKLNKSILISQVITPNEDGINDRWKIQGLPLTAATEICIYNQQAKRVFYHKGIYQNDWMGIDSKHSIKLDSGAYYYTIDIRGDGAIDYSGWLYLKRK